MIKPKYCLVVALLALSTTAFSKELPPLEKAAREPERSEKGGQIVSESIIDAARYLRWHRDAMALRARPDGANSSTRAPYLQL